MSQSILVFVWLLCALTGASTYEFSISSCVDDGNIVERGDTCEYSCSVRNLQAGDRIQIIKQKSYHYLIRGISLNATLAPILYSSTTGLNYYLKDVDRYSGKNHDTGYGVTLKISDVLPYDSGFLLCRVSNEDGVRQISDMTEIPVFGATVVPFFARTNSFDILEIYNDGDEITLTLDEASQFTFLVNVTGTMPVQPKAAIVAKYEEGTEQDITDKFFYIPWDTKVDYNYLAGVMDYAFVQENFAVLYIFHENLRHGKPTLTGTYSYATYRHTTSIKLDIIFKPEEFACDEVLPVLRDEAVSVTCHFRANPPPTSFTLQLPTGEVINSTVADDRFTFSQSQETSWAYSLQLTYKKITEDYFGQNKLIAENELGQSSYEYMMNDANEYAVIVNSCGRISKGSTCEYSCIATGLQPSDYLVIAKEHFVHYELSDTQEIHDVFVTFNSTTGLTHALQDTGRYDGKQEDHTGGLVKKATVTINDTIPGDSGGYTCYISGESGTVIKSNITYISVSGADVTVFFGKKSSNSTPDNIIIEERYAEDQEIWMAEEDLASLVFVVRVTGIMPVQPTAQIRAIYAQSSVIEDITLGFHNGSQESELEVDFSTGIGTTAYVQENFYDPAEQNLLKSDKGQIKLLGSYQGMAFHHVYIDVNFLFAPEGLQCKEPIPVDTGMEGIVHCFVISNPVPDYFAVELPDGQVIEPSPVAEVSLSVTSGRIEWHHNLTLTYKRMTSTMFGQNRFLARNSYDNISTVFEFRDLNAYSIETHSCIDDEKFVERNGFCKYSCQVEGLEPQEFFTVAKSRVTHYSLNKHSNVSATNIIFNSTHGLNPGLPNRYKAVLSSDNSSVTVNITGTSPADSGYYICFISNKDGEEILRSHQTYIPVLGANIETSFSPRGPEVSLTKEELDDLVFTVTVNDTMPVAPNASIVAHYSAVDLMENITRKFDHEDPHTEMEIREGGLLYVWETEIFASPDDNAIKTNRGKPKLVGTYEYAHYKIMSNLTINLLFAPDIICDNIHYGTTGKSLTVKCEFSTNPAADSFALKLPSGEIVDGAATSDVQLKVTPTAVEWLYDFTVTYQKLTSDMLGEHTVSIANKYGESTSPFSIKDGASTMELSYLTMLLLLVLKLFQDN